MCKVLESWDSEHKRKLWLGTLPSSEFFMRDSMNGHFKKLGPERRSSPSLTNTPFLYIFLNQPLFDDLYAYVQLVQAVRCKRCTCQFKFPFCNLKSFHELLLDGF